MNLNMKMWALSCGVDVPITGAKLLAASGKLSGNRGMVHGLLEDKGDILLTCGQPSKCPE